MLAIIGGKSLIALLATKLGLYIEKFRLIWSHPLRTKVTTKMLATKAPVERNNRFALNQLGAGAAPVAIDALTIFLAVGQTIHFKVAPPSEGFVAFGAGEMFHMPVFA